MKRPVEMDAGLKTGCGRPHDAARETRPFRLPGCGLGVLRMLCHMVQRSIWWLHLRQAVVQAWPWYGLMRARVPVRVSVTRRNLGLAHDPRFLAHRASILSVSALAAVCCVASGAAAAMKHADEQVERKTVTGQVVSITPGMISIEYARTETASKEILIPLDEETQLSHLRGLEDIREGDRVAVEHRETHTENDEGKWLNFKRVATKISLVRRATDALRTEE